MSERKNMNSFSSFEKPEDQKKLYFKINNHFEEKASGLYAIYKDSICLYVGQSSNLASRIATHLKGKYEECDMIEVYVDTEEIGELIQYEKQMIQKLKPIENVLADYSEEIDIEDNPCYWRPHTTIINSDYSIFIDTDMSIDLHSNDDLFDYVKGTIDYIEYHKEKL